MQICDAPLEAAGGNSPSFANKNPSKIVITVGRSGITAEYTIKPAETAMFSQGVAVLSQIVVVAWVLVINLAGRVSSVAKSAAELYDDR